MQFRLAVDGQAQVIDAMNRAERSMDRVEEAQGRMAQSAAVAASGMRGLLAAIGIGISVQGIINAADAVTTLQNSLKLATGSTLAAAQAYEDLFRIAQSSRTSFTELGATYASIARAGQSLGLSQQRLLTVTEAIGNAMTISGGNAQSMQDALVQLSQGLASGTLRGDELNSVIEQTPRLAQALAEGLGVTTGELRKLGEAGSLTAQQVIAALEKSAPQLAKEVQSATMTVGQAFTVLTNSATKFVGETDKATGASNTLAGAMKALSAAIDTAGEVIRKHEIAFAVIGGTLASATVAAGLVAVGTAIKGISVAVGLLNVALVANPVVLTLLGIGTAVGAIAAGTAAARSSMVGMAGEIESLTQRIATAQKQLDSVPEDKRGGALTEGLEKRIAAMRARLLDLQIQYSVQQYGNGAGAGRGNAQAEDYARQQAERTAAEKAYLEVRQELAGVDKEYLPRLKALEEARRLGIIDTTEYVAQVSELAKQTYKASDADKDAEAAKKNAAQAAEQNADRVKSLMDATDAKVSAGQLELQQLRDHDGTQQQLTKAQEYALGVMEKLRTGEVRLTTAQAARLAVQLEQLDADERERQRLERDDKWGQQAGDESARAIEAAQQQANSLQEQALAQQQANEAIGLSAVGVAELEAARLRDTAAAKDQYAAALETASPTLAQAYRDQAQALRDMADAKLTGVDRQTSVDAAKEWAANWKQVLDQTGQSLSDALMQGGRSAGKQLVQYFKTLAVRMVVQGLFVNPVSNALGLNASGSGGGVSSGLGAINTASSAYNAYSTGASLYTVGSQWAAGTMSAANAAGTIYGNAAAAMYGDGLSALLATNGAYGTAAAAGGTAAAAGGTAAGGAAAGGTAAGAGSAMSSVAAAAPYVAAALLVANALGLFKSTKRVGGGIVGTVGDTIDVRAYDLMRRSGSLVSGPKYSTRERALDEATTKAISTGVATMLAGTRGQAAALGLGDKLASFSAPIGTDLIHPDTGGYGIKLTGLNAEQAQAKIQEAMANVAERMAQQALGRFETVTTQTSSGFLGRRKGIQTVETYIGSGFEREGESAVQTLTRLTTSLATVNAAFKSLGASLLDASLRSGDLSSKLLDTFGGIEQFTASVSAYYDAIYSDAEKLALSQQHLRDAFGALGASVPDTAAAFRKLVEAQDLSTDAGRAAYATLVQLAPAWAEVRRALDEQDAAAQQLRDAWKSVGVTLANEIKRIRGLTAETAGQGFAYLQAQFAIATAQARAGDQSAAQALPQLSQSLLAAAEAGAATALDLARVQAAAAASLTETMRRLQGLGVEVPAFAAGGDHLGGLRLVGERGPELEVTGAARYYSNEQLGRMLTRGGSADDEVKQLLRQVLAELQALRAQSGNNDAAIAGHAAKLARLIERAMRSGDALAVQIEENA